MSDDELDIIDTHCHVLSEDLTEYPRAPIGGKQSNWATSRPITVEELVARMDEVGIARAVLVQASTAYGYDNSYVLAGARLRPDRFVAVGAIDPLRPDAAAHLSGMVGDDGMAGVRLFTTGSTLPAQGEWFAAPETFEFWSRAAGLDVTVCLQMHLGPATKRLEEVLDRFPDVRVLLDHAGYPGVAAGPERACAEVARLSGYPNLYLKFTHRLLEPLRDVGARASDFLVPVVDSFGAERIVWGSNCPTAEQSLPELLGLAREVLGDLTVATRTQIFAGTARRLYPRL